MTDHLRDPLDEQADRLRLQHLDHHGIMGLPWYLLRDSEQEQWRQAARRASQERRGTTDA